jgi:hypothetical protein
MGNSERKEAKMLWTIAAILTMLWLLGLISGYAMGHFVHILLFVAIIAILIHIEDDCNRHVLTQARDWPLKGHSVGMPGKILPKLAVLSGEKLSQSIISTATHRKEQPL